MSTVNTLIDEIFSLFSDIEIYRQHDKFPLEKRSKKMFVTMSVMEMEYEGYYDYVSYSQIYPIQIKLKVSGFASPDSSEEALYEILEDQIVPRIYKGGYNIKNLKITGAGYDKNYDRLRLASEMVMTGYGIQKKQ